MQILFFNISGSEFFDLYVVEAASGLPEFLRKTWQTARLHLELYGRLINIERVQEPTADAIETVMLAADDHAMNEKVRY
ncbi:MAG: hypothetical protein QX197_11430 [Methylococcaceae bacterium]